jgi:hypothetical protein
LVHSPYCHREQPLVHSPSHQQTIVAAIIRLHVIQDVEGKLTLFKLSSKFAKMFHKFHHFFYLKIIPFYIQSLPEYVIGPTYPHERKHFKNYIKIVHNQATVPPSHLSLVVSLAVNR